MADWQPIVGYGSYYEVSSTGLVRKRGGELCGRWLNSDGYMMVRLSNPRRLRKQAHNLAHAASQSRMQRDYWTGKRSPNAKLTDRQAQNIRTLYVTGNLSHAELAKIFNTNKRTIGRILNGETYAVA